MSKSKILIIDDEPFMVRPVLDRVEALYGEDSYIYAQYIGNAMAALSQNKISCVYLDLIMPWDKSFGKQESKITGINILSKIRAEHQDLPVVCYTVVNDMSVLAFIEKQKAFYIDKTSKNSFYKLFEFFDTNFKKND